MSPVDPEEQLLFTLKTGTPVSPRPKVTQMYVITALTGNKVSSQFFIGHFWPTLPLYQVNDMKFGMKITL